MNGTAKLIGGGLTENSTTVEPSRSDNTKFLCVRCPSQRFGTWDALVDHLLNDHLWRYVNGHWERR